MKINLNKLYELISKNLDQSKTLKEEEKFPIQGELCIITDEDDDQYDFSAQDGKTIADALMNGYFAENFTVSLYYCGDITEVLDEIVRALKSGQCPAGLKIKIIKPYIESTLLTEKLADALKSGNCPEGFRLCISSGYDVDGNGDDVDYMDGSSMHYLASALDSGKCPNGFTLDFKDTRFIGQSLTHLCNALKSEKLPKDFCLSIDLTDPGISPDTIDQLTMLINESNHQKFLSFRVYLDFAQLETKIDDDCWFDIDGNPWDDNDLNKFDYLLNFKSAHEQLELAIKNYFLTKAFIEATTLAQTLFSDNPILLEDSCLMVIKLLYPYQQDDERKKINFANKALATTYEAQAFSSLQDSLSKTTTLQQRQEIISEYAGQFETLLALHLKNDFGSFFSTLNKICNRLVRSLEIKNESSFFLSNPQANLYKFELKHKLMSHIDRRYFSANCFKKWVKEFYRGERTKEAGILPLNQDANIDFLDGTLGNNVKIGISDKLYSQFHSITEELLEESKAKSLLEKLKNEYSGQDSPNDKKVINSFFKLLHQEFHQDDLKRNREHDSDQRESKRIKLG